MDELIQANLEMHEQLGKEVRINLENEAKIKRLERQQARYEADIQYLYGVIEKLESQKECDKIELHSLRTQLAESYTQLKNCEKLCNEKEQFILFRESQLLESEDVIFRLKKRLLAFSEGKMARARTELVSLDTMTNTQLIAEIQENVERLYRYSIGAERLPNLGVATNLRDRTARASVIIHNTLVDEITEARNALKKCEEEGEGLRIELGARDAEIRRINHMWEESFEGSKAEMEFKDNEVIRLGIVCDELDNQLKNMTNVLHIRDERILRLENDLANRDEEINDARNDLRALIGESERLETNSDLLSNQWRRNLEQAERGIAERDILLNRYRNRLENCQYERDIAQARYRAEQTINRSLRRQRLALKITNRQLQIRLMIPPAIIPVIPPPQVEQIWLLL